MWRFWREPAPHRQAVRDALLKLAELPESARMTATKMVRPKPRTIAQWTQRYGRKIS